MKQTMFTVILAAAVLLGGTILYADPVVTVQSGPITGLVFNTSGALGAQATPWTISETFNAVAVGILQFTDTDGNALGPANPTNSGLRTGRCIATTILNMSGSAWKSFELELQEILGTP